MFLSLSVAGQDVKYIFCSFNCFPVHGMHRSTEVYALPGLQHEDSGDKVGWWPSVLWWVSRTWSKTHGNIRSHSSNCNISGLLEKWFGSYSQCSISACTFTLSTPRSQSVWKRAAKKLQQPKYPCLCVFTLCMWCYCHESRLVCFSHAAPWSHWWKVHAPAAPYSISASHSPPSLLRDRSAVIGAHRASKA